MSSDNWKNNCGNAIDSAKQMDPDGVLRNILMEACTLDLNADNMLSIQGLIAQAWIQSREPVSTKKGYI
jgi:hypothetical protein